MSSKVALQIPGPSRGAQQRTIRIEQKGELKNASSEGYQDLISFILANLLNYPSKFSLGIRL